MRVGEWPASSEAPPLKESHKLFIQINEEHGAFVLAVGDGLLGSLEQFADEQNGEFKYKFPGKRELRKLRKEQRSTAGLLADLSGPTARLCLFFAAAKATLPGDYKRAHPTAAMREKSLFRPSGGLARLTHRISDASA